MLQEPECVRLNWALLQEITATTEEAHDNRLWDEALLVDAE